MLLSRARLALAIIAARTTAALIRTLRLGYGSSLPGRVAKCVDPNILGKLADSVPQGITTITGTNGKTTITKLVAAILEAHGSHVFYNRGGANLESGVTAAFALNAPLNGRMDADFALMETDEATMPLVAPALRPRVIVANDFFRDQLDRFGELDSSVDCLRKALPQLRPGGALVLNADDPIVVQVARGNDARVVYFGLGEAVPGSASDDAADAVFCPLCQGRFEYRSKSYSHLGDWACPRCGYERPHPDVYAINIKLNGMRGSTVDVVTPDGGFNLTTVLPGLYSVYNILAATATAWALGVPPDVIGAALASASCGFGRSEFFNVKGQSACLLLVKNPTGFNEVLRAITQDPEPKRLFFAINDRLADGRDISWLWDVNLERLWERPEIAKEAVVTGLRALDMAVRLKYSGPDDLVLHVEKDLQAAVKRALQLTPAGETLYILSTYTAMLKLWEILNDADTSNAASARFDRTVGRRRLNR